MTSRTAAPRPNVIMVLCDDLGYGDVGVLHQNGRADRDPAAPVITTPRIDALAAEGLVLEGMYCPAPVCAPSRASLLTGLSQGHASLRDNGFDEGLPDAPTLATVLSRAGYATAAIGKWGLPGGGETGDEATPTTDGWPSYPTRRGFDHFFGYVRHRDGHEHYPKEGLYRGRKQVWYDDREVSDDLDGCYTTDLFTARAKAWITDRVTADPDRPFFTYLALDTPHGVTELPPCPWPEGGGLHGGVHWTGEPGRMITTAVGTPDGWYHPDHADRDWPEVYRRYATSIRRIDDAVGDLQQLIIDLGVDDSTMIIVTSDNGPSIESYLPEDLRADFFSSSGPFDGIKRDCWEGGVRVGAVVRAPGLVPAGRRSAEPAQFQDLLPTCADLAGIACPAATDGVSLVPLLTGVGEQTPSPVYVEYAGPGRTPGYARFAAARRDRTRGQMQLVRLGDLVGVRYDVTTADDPFEVYDVVADPGQRHDLAAERPELQQRLSTTAVRRRRPHPDRPRPYDGLLVPALGPDDPVRPAELRIHTGELPWLPAHHVPAMRIPTGAAGPLDPVAPAGVTAPPEATAAWWTGELVVDHDGDWRLGAETAHPVVLWLHDALVVDHGSGDAPAEGTIRLAAGRHPYRLGVAGAGPVRLTVTPVDG